MFSQTPHFKVAEEDSRPLSAARSTLDQIPFGNSAMNKENQNPAPSKEPKKGAKEAQARAQQQNEAEKLKAQQELEVEEKTFAEPKGSGARKIIQRLKEKVIQRLEVEQAEKEQLALERTNALEQIAAAEQERLKIQREMTESAAAMELERKKLSEANDENKAEIEAKIKLLQTQQEESANYAKERDAALEQVAKAEQERAKMYTDLQADRKRAQDELEEQRAKLAQSNEANRAEVESAMKRLEEQQQEKELLAKERAQALEQIVSAEKERAAIQAELQKSQAGLEKERAKLAEAEEAAREEIESAIRRLEQEQEEKGKLSQERAAALEQVSRVERERAAIQADRDRMQRELQEERVRLMDAAGAGGEAEAQVKEAMAKLEVEQAEKMKLAKEREEALEQVSRAEKERAEILAQKETAVHELEVQRNRLAQAEESSKAEIQTALKKLEDEQNAKDVLSKEREQALADLVKEHAEKDALLKEKKLEGDRAEEEGRLRRLAEEEVASAKAENLAKTEQLEKLAKEKAEQLAAEETMRARLAELQKTAEEAAEIGAEKAKMEEIMNQRLKDEKVREEAMAQKIADLQNRLEKVNDLDADRSQQEGKAKDMMQKLKREQEEMEGLANLSEEDRKVCPFLRKLAAESSTTQKAWTVFIDPKAEQGVTLGSDGTQCQIVINGLGVSPVHCRMWTRDDFKKVFILCEEGAILRINGQVIQSDTEKEIFDGSRLAIGKSSAHAIFFELEIPQARDEDARQKQSQDEENLARAMEEIDNNDAGDDNVKWGNLVQSCMFLVKQEFGTQEANAFVTTARKANKWLAEANLYLDSVPEKMRADVAGYELSILFDSHGLPIISVVARRLSKQEKKPLRMSTRASTTSVQWNPGDAMGSRDGSDTVAVWTMGTFREERLWWMQKASEDYEQDEEVLANDWRSQVWGDMTLANVKSTYAQNAAEKSVMAAKEEEAEQAAASGFMSWFGGASRKSVAKTPDAGQPESQEGGGFWGALLSVWTPESKAPGPMSKTKALMKQATKAALKNASAALEEPAKVRKQVVVPKLIDGKLGVKLKGGMYVVGFDHADAKEFGWHLHDEIIEVNGIPVKDRDSFAKSYIEAKKKLPIAFTVMRNDKSKKRTSTSMAAPTSAQVNPRIVVSGSMSEKVDSKKVADGKKEPKKNAGGMGSMLKPNGDPERPERKGSSLKVSPRPTGSVVSVTPRGESKGLIASVTPDFDMMAEMTLPTE